MLGTNRSSQERPVGDSGTDRNNREQLVNDSGTNGNSLWAILAEDDENKSYELAHRMSIKGLAENADETYDEVFGKLMVGI